MYQDSPVHNTETRTSNERSRHLDTLQAVDRCPVHGRETGVTRVILMNVRVIRVRESVVLIGVRVRVERVRRYDESEFDSSGKRMCVCVCM